jgi:hypothetical protein
VPANPVDPVYTCIAEGRIIEAQSLLDSLPPDALNEQAYRELSNRITERRDRAQSLFDCAETLEQAGRAAEAKALYQETLQAAADFPGIHDHIARLEDTLLLTRAVQRRTQRIRESQPVAEPASGSSGSKRRALALAGAGLVVGAGLTALLLLGPPGTTKPPVSQPVPPPDQIAFSPSPPSIPQTTPAPPSPLPSPDTPVPAETAVSQPVAPAITDHEEAVPLPPPVQDDPSSAPPVAPPTVAPPAATAPPPPSPGETDESETMAQESTVAAVDHPPTDLPPADMESAPPADPPAAPPEEPRLYRVRTNDSLSLIAQHLLCDRELWPEIYKKNREKIANPEHVVPGMVLDLTGIQSRCPHDRAEN